MQTPQPRRPTLKDVAAAAGVAPMTVSYAFNQPSRVAEATRERVLAAASELGYHPQAAGRALRSGRSQQLGIVVGEHLSYLFDNPQAAQFLAGVSDLCVREDMGMVLIPTRGDASDVDRVLSAAVDGYVLWTTVADDPVLAAVASSGRPAAIQGGPARPGLFHVGIDDRAAAAAIASRTPLADASPCIVSFPLDRRRTSGVLRGRDLPADLMDADAVPFPVTGARLAGYRDAIEAAGHEWRDVRVAVVERNQRELGEAAALALLDADGGAGPTVVLTMSDELALGARAAIGDRPSDVTLTGWDGTPEAMAAGIWSVAASLREQGRACAQAVLTRAAPERPIPWEVVAPA